MQTNSTPSITWSPEYVIDLIRTTRNDLIKSLLDECYLRDYLADKFSVKEISNVRIELIKKELKELLIDPIDVKYYEVPISRIKETGESSFSSNEKDLFYQEADAIIKSYIFVYLFNTKKGDHNQC